MREKTISLGLLICSAIFLSGLDRCQQDYYFAVKSNFGPTSTPTGDTTEEPTSTPGGPTESPEPTDTPEIVITDTPTAVPTVVPTSVPTAVATGASAAFIHSRKGQASAFLSGLSNLEKKKEKNTKGASTAPQQQNSSDMSGNWLGRIKTKNDDEKADTDRDGFTDSLEDRMGSDPRNPGSMPGAVFQTSLAQRLISTGDRDGDGILDQDEKDIALLDSNSDTDGDGCLDGLETLEGTDPADKKSVIRDSDGDCLGDSFEAERGLNPYSSDSDRDSLPDGLELVLGANPLDPDTDNDGILDGREVSAGSDPIVPDSAGR